MPQHLFRDVVSPSVSMGNRMRYTVPMTMVLQGLVIIEATIDADGRVTDTRVLRSIPLLDAAALAAVQQWRFAPTRLNGLPVPLVMTVTIQFSLR